MPVQGLFAICLVGVLSGCSSSGGGDPSPVPVDIQGDSTEIYDILIVGNPSNVLSYFVEWRTDRPAPTDLSVRCGDEFEHEYQDPQAVEEHAVFVMGLAAGWSCELEITATVGGATSTMTAYIDEIGPLPELPPIRVEQLDEERIEPGWTIWTLASDIDLAPLVVAVMDHQGRYRWYTQPHSIPRTGASTDIRLVEEGALVGGNEPSVPARLISWEGRVLWESPVVVHHDIRPSPFNDAHYLFLTNNKEGCAEDKREANIHEYDIQADEIIWTWRICDHYDPPKVVKDWSHTNTVAPIHGERAVLISNRNQNNVMKVNRDTDELEWVLGDNGDFDLDPEDRFMRQHAVEPQPNGNILMFDNGERGIREWSRAAEYALTFDEDGAPLGAELVWEFRDESLFGAFKSDADRLANDNTLVTFSNTEDTDEALILEVNMDGEVLWELRSGPEWRTYRALRVDPFYGYVKSAEM